MAVEVRYEWRGRDLRRCRARAFTDSYGGASAAGWWDRIRPFSLGWVVALLPQWRGRRLQNVTWDGCDHAFLIDTKVRADLQHNGIGTELVRVTRQAKRAGCEWLHVDYREPLAPFYEDACGFRPTPASLIHLPDFDSS